MFIKKGKEEKIMKKKLVVAVLTASMMAFGMTGCGSSEAESTATTASQAQPSTTQESEASVQESVAATEEQQAEEEKKALSGSITLAGSTSMEKLCEALSESFMEAYPDVTVTVEYTGSGAGLESLAAGSVDIGNASRHLKDTELATGAVENVVAIDGIAVITDSENTTVDISAEDLAKVYTGEITNWSELGGEDEAIVVIGREAGSGTRDAFEELLEVSDECAYAQELDSTGAVLAKVSSTPGSIGYVSLDVVDDSVLAVSLDGVAPTEENILAGQYLLSRPFVMATNGEISAQNELVQEWFSYLESEEGKNVISTIGLIIPN